MDPQLLKASPVASPWVRRFAVAGLTAMASCAAAQDAADCAGLTDDALRLACYDKLFRGEHHDPYNLGTQPEDPLTSDPLDTAESSRDSDDFRASEPASALTRFWELSPETKGDTFTVRTHLPNFVMPLHYTSSINRSPSSPTRQHDTLHTHYRPVEAKIQISLRSKIVEDFLLPNADLWFAYTQRSLWQVWDHDDSAPFRSTDYQPEAIYVIPVPQRLAELSNGWHWRMVQLGLAHQSNGQSNPLSRSWNRIYAGTGFERGDIALQLRLNHRLRESGNNDNPDLTHYIGNTEVLASWLPGQATTSLLWRTHPGYLSRGSLQLDLTYPVYSSQPEGLRWYVQLFTGYGETLLDYNHRQSSIGFGLSLFQF